MSTHRLLEFTNFLVNIPIQSSLPKGLSRAGHNLLALFFETSLPEVKACIEKRFKSIYKRVFSLAIGE